MLGADLAGVAGLRLVVRIAGVRADADDRRMVAGHAVFVEMLDDALLHFEFVNGTVAFDALGDEAEGDIVGRAGVHGGLLVHSPLLVVPGGLEELNEIAGRNNFEAEGTDQFDGAAIDAGNIGIGVAWNVLHGDALGAGEQLADARFQLLPLRVASGGAGDDIEGGGFDTMDQFARLALGGDEVKPAARKHLVVGQPDDALGQDIEAAEVVQQPPVELLVADGGLNRADFGHVRPSRRVNFAVSQNSLQKQPGPRDMMRLLIITALSFGAFGMDTPRPPYPPSKTEPIADNLHGVTVPDPYRWLEEGDNPAVREWTEKQNAFTRNFLDQLPGRPEIRQQLDRLLEIGTITAPRPAKGKYFYTKREGKQNQPVLYVREGVNGADRVLLDVNQLASDGTTALDWYFPSEDGRYLAYGLSAGGTEQSTLRIREVATGKDLPDVIERCRACSLAWLRDASGFYYTRYPLGGVPAEEMNYHRHVYLHKLGTDPANDVKVFGSGRAKEDWPNVALSPNGKWLAVTAQQGWAKSEVYVADASKQPLTFTPLVEGVSAIFEVDVNDDAIYVRTNENAPRYKVYRVNPNHMERANWKEIIPEGVDVLESVTVVGQTLATVSMQRASSRLRLHDLNGELKKNVDLPTLGSITGIGAESDGKELFYGFTSFTMPPRVYRLDLPTQESQLWNAIKADVNFDAFEVTQVEYPSKDGTKVSMFLASKKGLVRNGQNPTLLYGYGGFNQSITPTFSASRVLFLERGGVLAIANLRGGGEYGEAWHASGMLGKKQNVFDDFIAAAEWLVREKITSPDRLAIQGGSNGGLLVGAAMTQRPDLFRAVVCQVPLLDMVRYHKFLIARLWIPEYGSAENAEQFQWLNAYSPYHRVKDGAAYPATLITAAEGDSRVDPLHARKMAARLQAANGSSQPILVRLETKAGHGAGKPRGKQLDELVDIYSFLFEQLGMKP